MAGYVSCIGTCFACKKPFSFNPNKVPSLRVEGVKREICRTCIEIANPKRIANGLEPVAILPGAYEACPEEEVF
jgi:hypothetical protein